MSTTLIALRAATDAGSAEQKREMEKKRNILILINAHLIENGYTETAERLQHEAGSVINKFEVADNIDLSLILSDFETYNELRLGKKPKLVRKLKDDEIEKKTRPPKPPIGGKSTQQKDSKPKGDSGKLPYVNGASNNNCAAADDSADDGSISCSGLGVQGSSVSLSNKKTDSEDIDRIENRLLKPPPQFFSDPDMKLLAGVISKEIYQESPNVRFEDIIRLDEAKRLLCEAVQLPLKYPTIFTGILRPWKGILLHGPPGTGKTMLAKAVATECRTTFFNISASTLVSKWRGDSEKLVRALFELARHHAPSTIFVDEIDSILGARGGDGGGGEHEASRRMKTELLVQMDGLRASKLGEQVFVMAASNLPWDLDIAVLRRLEKRVLVPLPEAEARVAMLRKHLQDRTSQDIPFDELAASTEGYSGADIELLCREAAMRPVRRLMTKLIELEKAMPTPMPGHARSSAVGRILSTKTDAIDVDSLLRSDPVTAADVLAALETTRPSSDGKMDKYNAWQSEYGSV